MTNRSAALLLVLSLVTGCGGAVQSGAPPAASQVRLGSTIPGFLYIGDLGTSAVDVLRYPQDTKAFKLKGFATVNGLCTDFYGNVYVSDSHDGELDEYLYGQNKLRRSLQVPGYFTLGCAVNVYSGDLAVAIQSPATDPGGIAIFKHAKGKPDIIINSTTFSPSQCAYDDHGNLFFDGSTFNGNFFFAEVPRKTKTSRVISLPQQISVPGGVQFDGRYIAVGDQGVGYKGSTIYEFSIKGTTATEEGTTPLDGSQDVIGFWIGDGYVIGGNIGSSPAVEYWNYPAGGSIQKTLTGFKEPVAVRVAKEPSAF
jgi:hypothetical protein